MLRRILTAGVSLTALVGAGIALVAPGAPEARQVDWENVQAGPRDELRVAWVGHSLMNARDPQRSGAKNVLEQVGALAQSQGLAHESFDATLFGAPLSLLWRGRPHSYTRDEPAAATRREELLAGHHDALVITEGVPLRLSTHREHSSYYLQRFYCDFLAQNPDARVYLYESWVHFQGSDPDAEYFPPHQWTWTDQLGFEREHWDALADEAMTGQVTGPKIADRFARLFGHAEGQCAPHGPIYSVPVATAMRTLAERLAQPHDWSYQGRPMSAAELVTNPYTSWPEGWPTEDPLTEAEVEAALSALPKRYPSDDYDDVHPSDLGVYFASLVSWSTLYRRSPIGLPSIDGLPAQSATGLQELVWQVVLGEPRTGVAR